MITARVAASQFHGHALITPLYCPPGIIPYFYYKSAYALYRTLPRASTTTRTVGENVASPSMRQFVKCTVSFTLVSLFISPFFSFLCVSLVARFNLSLMRAGARGHVYSTMAKGLVSK